MILNKQHLWLIFRAALIVIIVGLSLYYFIGPGITFSPTPTPTPPPTASPAPAETAHITSPQPTEVEIAQDQPARPNDNLGEVEVKYPLRMSPGSSDSVFTSIYIPPALVSVGPVEIDRIDIPPDAPPIIGELNTYHATIIVSETMRVELSSPTFVVEKQYPDLQAVTLQTANQPTFWAWTIVAPETAGQHTLTLRIFHGQEERPMWLRSIKIEVTTPKAASFWSTSVGLTVLGVGGILVVVLMVGVIGYVRARDTFPLIGTKASYQRTLKTLYRNLARLEEQSAQYGLDVPTKLANEIDLTREKIAEIEERLKKSF
ncbi:MAG: hypothetical protein U0401_29500 [Anaerolineae bacterium]